MDISNLNDKSCLTEEHSQKCCVTSALYGTDDSILCRNINISDFESKVINYLKNFAQNMRKLQKYCITFHLYFLIYLSK